MSQSMQPTISVVIPLYNKAAYVEKAIASALESGPCIHEVIVVDDGSTDEGPQVVERISDPRIKLIRQRNQGVSAARNRGIHTASSDYIAFLDADDYWTPQYIPRIAQMIAEYPQCGMFATRYFGFNEKGDQELPQLHTLDSGNQAQLLTHFFEAWATGPIFYTCSVVIPKRIFFDYNIFFPVNESLGEDQDVWFRIAEKFPTAYCATPLVAYRMDTSFSLSKASSGTTLPPFIQRLKQRYDAKRIPAHHRKGVSRVLGLHQLILASRLLQINHGACPVPLLFDRFSIQKPRFWMKVFFLACLPKMIRLRILEKH